MHKVLSLLNTNKLLPYNALAETIVITSSKTLLQGKVPAELLVNQVGINDNVVVVEFLALILSKNLLSLFVNNLLILYHETSK